MKKYKLGYDYLFLPKESFTYKGDYIGAMTVDVLFTIYDEKGNEIPFESEDGQIRDQAILFHNTESYYLSDLIICSFDREKIMNFDPNIPLMPLLSKFDFGSFSWKVESYWKDLDKGILEPEKITETEFMDIMKNNINLFDNSNNYPTQTTSFFTKEIQQIASL